MEIIVLKMKRDLLKMSLEYTDNLDIDEEEFSHWITERINHYIDKEKISFSKDENDTQKNNCSARLWNNGRGEKQCTHKRTDTDYCDKHNRMLREEGVLRFGDVRDSRPTHDLIKKKNNIIEKLHWIDPDPLNQIQQVLDKQRKKVICCGTKLIVS